MEAKKSSLIVIAAFLLSAYAATVNPSINMPNDLIGYYPSW